MKDLNALLEDYGWLKRFSKRGVAFFLFLQHWTQYVHHLVVVYDSINWWNLPGYQVLIKAFLVEMKKRELTHYPEALKTCSVVLINNSELLNIFVKIVFLKTK